MKRPTANHFGRCSQMLVDGQGPLDDTWCLFLPCRGIFNLVPFFLALGCWRNGVVSLHSTLLSVS